MEKQKQKAELDELKKQVSDCQQCELSKTRKNIVFGEGNPNADIMVIGEAPGATEDEQGRPFVGRAGNLVTEVLESVNFTREEVYISNVCKCRPPENNLNQSAVDACEAYLQKEIAIIKPKIILALGVRAAEAVLKQKIRMCDVHGKVFDYQGAKILVTYHPTACISPLDIILADVRQIPEIINPNSIGGVR
ncbi:MAG: uracil-DNA glycosylase [Ignavibacteria bacterium]|jgi:DNA polymerase|nr:uracil-DNA glycosylase [Ignavibacteria bacterium]